MGIALADGQPHRNEEVLKDAELAMYHAKRIGGDRIEVFKPSMRARKTDRLTLESELRRALERDEITILYQPIVRLEDRSVAGFEALARWDHPKMGRTSPSEFIAIAEEIGLIVDLGMFVLERTARQLASWQRTLRPRDPLFASVNLSSRQLLRQDLIHDLRTVIARAGLARGSLKLELTESLVMENPEHAAQMLQRIRELGAGLALDDFGTGHSSLAYLQRFPFDTIKIDQSFVRTNGKGTRPVILRSIVALAHDLGMEVVAEGAETDSDAVELYQLGCEYAQGYHFGEPMSAEDARNLLQAEGVRDQGALQGNASASSSSGRKPPDPPARGHFRRGLPHSKACRGRYRSSAVPSGTCPRYPDRRSDRCRPDNAASRCAGSRSPTAQVPSRHSRVRGWHSAVRCRARSP